MLTCSCYESVEVGVADLSPPSGRVDRDGGREEANPSPLAIIPTITGVMNDLRCGRRTDYRAGGDV